MLKIGIIGAGNISIYHIASYEKNSDCEVTAICDVNKDLAQDRAAEYGIATVYTDYKALLQDKNIDAVSIVTPTFTHKDIVIDALRSGKHVLCEKPPALNADEVIECEKVAGETGKLLMFAFVCRYRNPQKYLKSFVDSGKMGEFISASCERSRRCVNANGWFSNREKGGGVLRDECIHELDGVMYLMDYPNPVAVMASESYINSELPDKLSVAGWKSYDKTVAKRNIESAIEGFVTLENGASVHIKTSAVLNVLKEKIGFSIYGKNAGAEIVLDENFQPNLKIVELDNNEFKGIAPEFEPINDFQEMIDHFADCALNGTQCNATPHQAAILMRIIDAMYESAKTGMPVVFKKK